MNKDTTDSLRSLGSNSAKDFLQQKNNLQNANSEHEKSITELNSFIESYSEKIINISKDEDDTIMVDDEIERITQEITTLENKLKQIQAKQPLPDNKIDLKERIKRMKEIIADDTKESIVDIQVFIELYGVYLGKLNKVSNAFSLMVSEMKQNNEDEEVAMNRFAAIDEYTERINKQKPAENQRQNNPSRKREHSQTDSEEDNEEHIPKKKFHSDIVNIEKLDSSFKTLHGFIEKIKEEQKKSSQEDLSNLQVDTNNVISNIDTQYLTIKEQIDLLPAKISKLIHNEGHTANLDK